MRRARQVYRVYIKKEVHVVWNLPANCRHFLCLNFLRSSGSLRKMRNKLRRKNRNYVKMGEFMLA